MTTILRNTVFGAVVFCLLVCQVGASGEINVVESQREIPIVWQGDVLVVGGTSGGVAAALAATEQGAETMLIASRTYLGVDMCASYRLYLEPGEVPGDDLARKLFVKGGDFSGLDFSYATDAPSGGRHVDTNPPRMLNDKNWSSAASESVEYSKTVTVSIDLGQPQELARVSVYSYQNRPIFAAEQVAVWGSTDKQQWRKLGAVSPNDDQMRKGLTAVAVQLAVDVQGRYRYLRCQVDKDEKCSRMLLGEIVIENAAAAAKDTEPSSVPRPLHVKRTLEKELLEAGVPFLFSSFATDVLVDDRGDLCGVVIANRSGRQALLCKQIIDATPRSTVARLAGAAFSPYPAGKQTFQRAVVGGAPVQGDGIRSRTFSAPEWLPAVTDNSAADGTVWELGPPKYWDHTCVEYAVEIDMADGSFASFAEAEQVARDKTFSLEQFDASTFVFQVPPDPVTARKTVAQWPGADNVDLDAFRPKGIDNLYTLNGCAAVSRQAAEALLRPLAFMTVGRRIGESAADQLGKGADKRIVCFGDSITRGSYPAKLDKILAHAKVTAQGVSGETTRGALQRLDQVIAEKPDIVVMMYGTNDVTMTGADAFRVPIDEYEKNLRAIVSAFQKNGIEVVLCTPPAINSVPYYTRHAQEYYDPYGGIEKVLQDYRQVVFKVARSMSIPVVDQYATFARDMSTLGQDGVHPLEKGHDRMAQAIARSPMFTAQFDLADIKVKSPAVSNTADRSVRVKELLVGLRATQKDLPTITSTERSLPVLGRYDVVVVGGGTGGAPAGIAAARHGAKTLVVEYVDKLGGVSTAGLIGIYYFGNLAGFTEEIDNGVRAMGPLATAPKSDGTPVWNIEYRSEWLRRELRKAGGELWTGCIGCGTLVEDGVVKGVVVATPQGRGVVLADVVIDSTGSSDIAVAAGAEYTFTSDDHAAIQGTGLPFRNIYNLGKHRIRWYANTDYMFVEDTDMLDIWRAFVGAREKFKDHYDVANLIDTRERRRIVGDFTVSPTDILNHRTYDDTVVLSRSNLDTHGYTVHPVFMLRPPDKSIMDAYTPFRSLLPQGLEGIIVTGLGISAHRDAMPILRMQPCIQNQGYAAGMIAATASKQAIALRKVDIDAIQEKLVAKGCLPKSVLTDKDSFPLDQRRIRQAVEAVKDGWQDLHVLLAQPDVAIPMVRQAYKETSKREEKLIYAQILGMYGDATGSDLLIEHIAETPWDSGWNFRGGGQYGGSMSRLDCQIMSLGRSGDKNGLGVIIDKMSRLRIDQEFSHFRAVATALEELADASAAKPLADLLNMPGMSGHTIDQEKLTSEAREFMTDRSLALREIVLARALYRCGDYNGLGEQILRAYEQDLRGHYSRHAQAVLQSGMRP